MLSEFRFRRIRSDAAVYGVVGNPVMHSLSPVMHNAAFAALGLNAVYVPLQAADADDFVTFASAIGLRGASVTAPFKVDMLDRVQDADPLARRVGAINTVAIRDGRWQGANTDVEGFLAPLSGRMTLKGTRATVLGAGGAARGVAVALAGQGAAVTIAARRTEAAREIAAITGGAVGAWPPRPGSWDVLVNATPTAPGALPVAGLSLDGEIVFDLVYDAGGDAADPGGPRRRMPDDRGHRDAGRPGGAAVRVVDRAAAARRAHARVGRARDRRGAHRRRGQGRTVKQTSFEEFVDLARARHLRAGRARRSSPTC